MWFTGISFQKEVDRMASFQQVLNHKFLSFIIIAKNLINSLNKNEFIGISNLSIRRKVVCDYTPPFRSFLLELTDRICSVIRGFNRVIDGRRSFSFTVTDIENIAFDSFYVNGVLLRG